MFNLVTFEFVIDGIPQEWDIVHNLHQFGLCIENAFVSWLARTNEYTESSFCNYVMHKDLANYRVMTKKTYESLCKLQF